MATEWRSNLWLCIQLIIVGLVLWVFSWELLSIWDNYSSDGAFDYRNVYSGSLNYIEDTSSAYVPQPEGHTVNDDLNLILSTMRANPYVEEAAYGTNALPYNFSSYNSTFSLPDDTITPRYNYNNRFMDPEMLRVLNIKGVHGESTEDLIKMLKNNKVIISQYDKDDFSEKYLGQNAISPYDSSKIFSIGAVIKPFRRNDFEPQYGGTLITLLSSSWDNNAKPRIIAIRLKDGANGRQFLESLNLNDLHVGNVLVYDIKSLESQRESAQRSYWSTIRTTVVGAVFLLVIVFLGFIGTFWFRTRQRRSEIAVRKVNGATDGDIYRRLFSEGLMILIIAVIVSIPLTYLLLAKVPEIAFNTWLRWPSFIVSAAAMALMIMVGVWFPARNAVAVEPAEALHEE